MQLGRQGNLVVHQEVEKAGGEPGVHSADDPKRPTGGFRIWFWCPGCDELHAYRVGTGNGPRWTFNGDFQVPTFSPSLLMRTMRDGKEHRCHLFLEGGQLKFLGDCTHSLASQTVPIPEPPEWLCS